MIELIKCKNRRGDKALISKDFKIEIQESGMMLKFPANDNRKPSYVVLIDDDSLRQIQRSIDIFSINHAKKSPKTTRG